MSNTVTVVALDEPDQDVVMVSLLAVVPQEYVRQAADSTLLEVEDGHGTTMFAVELPRLIRVPGEVSRLLAGASVNAVEGAPIPSVFSDHPDFADPEHQDLWWQEITVRNGIPDGEALGYRLAQNIAVRCRGAVVGHQLPGSEEQG
jgi:hypothetical protein